MVDANIFQVIMIEPLPNIDVCADTNREEENIETESLPAQTRFSKNSGFFVWRLYTWDNMDPSQLNQWDMVGW